jgi:hypothetical protein
VSAFEDVFALQQLVARFGNCFDTKDWAGLGHCLKADIHTDYSDLRGTPPERMSSLRFVELRRTALHDLQTHHLSGNVEINVSNTSGEVKTSTVIYRRNTTGEILNTHCMYVFGVERVQNEWLISSIVQKVFIRDGQKTIHKGILKA